MVGIGELLWDLFPSGKEMGGAPANFAYHAQALGATGVVVSRVGDDDPGREIVARLRATGLDVSAVSVDREHPTGTVTVRLDAEGKPDFTIHENVAWDYISPDSAQMALADRAECVCFGTLARRLPVSRRTIREFLDRTPDKCLRVFDVNLRGNYYDSDLIREGLHCAGVLKLNDEELPVLAAMLGLQGPPAEILGSLVREYSLRAAALTRGAKGCLLAGPKETAEHPGFPPVRLESTVGAGDAFTAALAIGMLKGGSLAEIAAKANRVAGHVCAHAGAMPPVPRELGWDQ